MNTTQKGAWLNVAVFSLSLVLPLYIVSQIWILHRPPERIWLLITLVWAAVLFIVLGIGLVSIYKKQSPAEPESDERDNLIKYRAVLAAFFSVWALLYAVSMIPKFIVGSDGSIPVFLLPIINFGVFYIVILVYSVAVLIQYSRGGKENE